MYGRKNFVSNIVEQVSQVSFDKKLKGIYESMVILNLVKAIRIQLHKNIQLHCAENQPIWLKKSYDFLTNQISQISV